MSEDNNKMMMFALMIEFDWVPLRETRKERKNCPTQLYGGVKRN